MVSFNFGYTFRYAKANAKVQLGFLKKKFFFFFFQSQPHNLLKNSKKIAQLFETPVKNALLSTLSASFLIT